MKLQTRSYEETIVNGIVLIVEAVVGGVKESESMSRRLSLLYYIGMMVYKMGGKERTKKEFKGLFLKKGFKRYTIIKFLFLKSSFFSFKH